MIVWFVVCKKLFVFYLFLHLSVWIRSRIKKKKGTPYLLKTILWKLKKNIQYEWQGATLIFFYVLIIFFGCFHSFGRFHLSIELVLNETAGTVFWRVCSPPFHDALEKQYSLMVPTNTFCWKQVSWTHDLVLMKQTNQSTGKVKLLRRIRTCPPVPTNFEWLCGTAILAC